MKPRRPRAARFDVTLAAILAAAATLAACSGSKSTPDSTFTLEQLKDPTTCKQCHAEQYKEWSGSMHAYASVDPVFRAMNARGQRETHGELGGFCAKCHAPMVYEEDPDSGAVLDPNDPKLQGITCYFCHQVKDVTDTHNNGLVLANDTTMRGGILDPVPNKAHHSAYSTLHDGTGIVAGSNPNGLESSKLCGSCHDIVVPAHFSGASQDVALERTYQEWIPSIFDQTGPNATACGSQGCHTRPTSPGSYYEQPVASETGIPGVNVPTRPYRHPHDFPSVDVALTDFPERAAQRNGVFTMLDAAFTVRMCVAVPQPILNLTIENVGVGHNVPSGASQDRRMWFEIHAYDDKGRQVFQSGVVPPGRSPTELLDPTSDIYDPTFASFCAPPAKPCDLSTVGSCVLQCDLFRDTPVDVNGNPVHMFWQAASVPGNNRQTFGVSLTADMTNPIWHRNNEVGHWTKFLTTGIPARITVTLWVQPIGIDVIQDLVQTGDLDPSLLHADPYLDAGGGAADGGTMLQNAMPTFAILPNANASDAGIQPSGAVTLDWNPTTVAAYVAANNGENSAFGECATTAPGL